MDIVQRCKDLDRLLTVEMGSERVPMGMIARLYDYTRGDGGPITLQIADALLVGGTGRCGHDRARILL